MATAMTRIFIEVGKALVPRPGLELLRTGALCSGHSVGMEDVLHRGSKLPTLILQEPSSLRWRFGYTRAGCLRLLSLGRRHRGIGL